ncbi:hypothetical protein [Mesorhizobium sp. A556]
MEPIAKFWMVYCMDGGSPTFKHLTKDSAQAEAKRLAERSPGKLFVVLAAVDSFKCPLGPVESVKLRKATEEEILDNDIPF